MIKKQTITAAVCAVLAIVLAVVYFTVIAPSLVPKEKEVVPIELIDQLEVRHSDQQRVYLFPPAERARISSIKVSNEHGGYEFYKKKDTFYLRDKETAPYNLKALASVVTSTGTVLADARYLIDENTDLSVYGLAASDNPAYFVVTTEDGTIHKVWVGKKVPTDNSYYCQYDGRKAVYKVGLQLGLVVFTDVYGLIDPVLGLNIDQTQLSSVPLIGAIKHGVPSFEIKTLTPDENGSDKTNSPTYSYEFTFNGLKEFTPSSIMRNYVLQTLSGLAGTKTVAVGNDITVENLKTKYGIDINDPYYCIYYTHTDKAYIYISAPDKEGICYAYSTVYNIVTTIPLSSMPMYYLGVHDFVEGNLLKTPIMQASKLEIKGSLPDENITIDSSYGIKTTYINDTQQSVQTVWNNATKEEYSTDRVANFKQIYGDIAALYIEGEVDVNKVGEGELLLSITLTEIDGTVRTFEFFAYNNTRCYFKLNGSFNKTYAFYVNRDNVEALIRNTHLFEQGYTLDPGI